MTTIVWDGKQLATDCAASDGSAKWKSKKAWYHSDARGEVIISGVGTLTNIIAMRDWYRSGAIPEQFPTAQTSHGWCQLLVVTAGGLLRYEKVPVAIEHGFYPCAFGEGRDFALGAMAMGADAATAVSIANQYSPTSGLGVDVYTIATLHSEEGELQ